ncbi:hypothetical protein [Actinopolymorpha cephalotaxi]|nr:hypothetical protein [Actinopolymorpha cephalotaxi]NYH86309.1 hypothetical protein [Actinopolymorpha cephalotaxi]
MGHDSMRAALIYQHRTRGADEAIAAAVDARVRAARVCLTNLGGDSDDGSGTSLTGAG